ncbi:MAG TPA: agmatine deiminase family protein [Candidatus Blautia merdipullorum]|nr:agmatine deiminase family protein [Candidatus Blautia merdipullorum]
MKKRIAAEWEPAKGVLVSWPPLLPRKIFEEFNKDTIMYVMVMDNDAEKDGKAKFLEWGLNMERIRFIMTPPPGGKSFWGNYWVRDWGPYALFDEHGEMSLLCGRFCSTPAVHFDRPTELMEVATDDVPVDLNKPTGPETYMTGEIADYFGWKHRELPYALIGGNVLTDGLDLLLSSETLLEENRQMNHFDPETFIDSVTQETGMTSYAITGIYEDFGIQHLDCIMKVIDEDTLFVAKPPADHPYYERIEKIVNECFSKVKNYYGRPFRIIRFDTDRYQGDELAAYSNSLILNKTVYVPMFGIECDKKALDSWRRVMPGYSVKGIEYHIADEPESQEPMSQLYENIGWYAGDALHCRTRAVWDPDMLYISVNKIPYYTDSESQKVEVIIKNYGKCDKVKKAELFYRVTGTEDWKNVPLRQTCILNRYEAEIPGTMPGTSIDYYIEAETETGNRAQRPITAPEGYFQYIVK